MSAPEMRAKVIARIEAGVDHIGGPDDHSWRSDCGGCRRIDRDRAYLNGYANGEAAARAESDALRAALEEGRRRVADLRDCNKDDDCHVMAKGAALVIEDIEYALAPSPAEGESR